MAKERQIFVEYFVGGWKKGNYKKIAFTGEPNFEHVDGHYNGHLQDGENVNYKRDLLVSRWKKWMNYIIPRRLDFDLANFR